jgi:hypothetical protein
MTHTARPHNVQPTPPEWTPPEPYHHYHVGETVTIPINVGDNAYRTVTLLDGPHGDTVAVDFITKDVVLVVTPPDPGSLAQLARRLEIEDARE